MVAGVGAGRPVRCTDRHQPGARTATASIQLRLLLHDWIVGALRFVREVRRVPGSDVLIAAPAVRGVPLGRTVATAGVGTVDARWQADQRRVATASCTVPQVTRTALVRHVLPVSMGVAPLPRTRVRAAVRGRRVPIVARRRMTGPPMAGAVAVVVAVCSATVAVLVSPVVAVP